MKDAPVPVAYWAIYGLEAEGDMGVLACCGTTGALIGGVVEVALGGGGGASAACGIEKAAFH